ncbi:hypothetical protein [Streptomyces sp. TLI_105]|uniref:hypothetical protein n=1 Tax=Streptomyces sp. TLI_105 TaxID=1881019 RepID=UPI00089B60C2|nr:hypothetical protein [Streptomyces sp. TLI_105]SEC36961.1 hypothetical protein SAMN05428939_2198 [Streptomyces sp. TLI_105]
MGDTAQRYAVTVGGRAYELIPSGGEVVLPVHGRKIHHQRECGHLTDADSLPRRPDPDGLLWRRLLDAGRGAGPAAGGCEVQAVRDEEALPGDLYQAFLYARTLGRSAGGAPPVCVLVHPGDRSAGRPRVSVRELDGHVAGRVRAVPVDLRAVLDELSGPGPSRAATRLFTELLG